MASPSSSSTTTIFVDMPHRRLDSNNNIFAASTTNGTSSCSDGGAAVDGTTTGDEQLVIRIATWSYLESTLQSYVDAYREVLQRQQQQQQQEADDGNGSSESAPQNVELRVVSLSHIADLVTESALDFQLRTGLYDAFAMPPIIFGELYQQNGLAELRDDDDVGDGDVDDGVDASGLLPYYRDYLTFRWNERDAPLATPLFLGGDQLFLLYRKDVLRSKGFADPPATWDDFVSVAQATHYPAQGFYGNCIGRLSRRKCRRSTYQAGTAVCRSLTGTMNSMAMMLASQTQTLGPSAGYLFDIDESTGEMRSLLSGPFETALTWLEQQIKYGAPNQRDQDISLNYDLFARGQCAMTIVNNIPINLQSMANVGVAPLPGAKRVLDRTTRQMVDCTPETCPHGTKANANDGSVNRVPFGVLDGAVVGAISNLITPERQRAVRGFFKFVADNPNFDTTANGSNATDGTNSTTATSSTRLSSSPSWMLQPFRESGLAELDATFAQVVRDATSHPNVAAPFALPLALDLLNTMDLEVNRYLDDANATYTPADVRTRIEDSWARDIDNFDNNRVGAGGASAIPLAAFYRQSLGTFEPAPANKDLYIGTPLRSVGYSIAGISVLLSVFFAGWVAWNRAHRVVLASQPFFLWMLCFGTFVLASSIFIAGLEDDIVSHETASRACMAEQWLYYLGTTITFSALFSKTWRINQIFRNAKTFHRVTVEAKDVLVPFIVMFVVNVVILTVWTVVGPLEWERRLVDENEQGEQFRERPFRLIEPDTYGRCHSEHEAIYSWILFASDLLVAIFALIQAYECRKISTEYSESVWINGALLCIVQVWLVGIPVLQLLEANPGANFFVKAGIVYVTCMATLLFLFLPKMRFVREQAHKERVAKARRDQLSSGNLAAAAATGGEEARHVSVTGLERTNHDGDDAVVGLRIASQPDAFGRSEQVRQLQAELDKAQGRNRLLRDRLERLQERLVVQQQQQRSPTTTSSSAPPNLDMMVMAAAIRSSNASSALSISGSIGNEPSPSPGGGDRSKFRRSAPPSN